MEATEPKKKDNTALYIVYAAAAYFGLQFLFKPKRTAAASIVATNAADTVPAPMLTTEPASVIMPVTTPVSSWIAESFPLRKGMKGSRIKALQQKLRVSTDGAFGNNTEFALLQQYGISSVSEAQYQQILQSSTTTATVATGTKSTWVAESFPLRKGMKGSKIKALQQKIGLTPDGAFGNNTEAAVIRKFGSNIVSEAMFQSLFNSSTQQTTVKSAWVAESFPLRKGMKGSKIKALQQKLGISPDGAFGNNTEAALRNKYKVTTVSAGLYQSITQPVSSSISKLLNTLLPNTGSGTKDNSAVLKNGSRGTEVYRLQKWLGFKDKQLAKKGEAIADSIFGKQTEAALLKKTGFRSITVSRLNTLLQPISGVGFAGEVLVTKRPATILDGKLLPHKSVPENTILGTRLMELSDPQERKAYTQFQTIDGFKRWIDADAV